MTDKVIVTNRSVLLNKYGKGGLAKIEKALRALQVSDKKRGITSRVIYLDNSSELKTLGGGPVQNAMSPRENKSAVDSVYKALRPDYLMILGASDVVPHQQLNNLTDDEDKVVDSDLPYACDEGYSRAPSRFIGPTRVVGRLPDLAGATSPTYLLTLLKHAANWKGIGRGKYSKYFGLTAADWKVSTCLSVESIFGDSSDVMTSPAAGPHFRNRELSALSHFINCHGGQAFPEFQGQRGKNYPVALTSADTQAKIRKGTVAAVECCYGAELYDPVLFALDIPICQSYLKQGAYGYLGSTTIAYGPADDNGVADLICQYFLNNVLNGASVGRAALMARQQYVAATGQMDPVDLKTLSQFYLLGDPSIHPVKAPADQKAAEKNDLDQGRKLARVERREKLSAAGEFLMRTKPIAAKRVLRPKLSANAKQGLANICKLAGLGRAIEYSTFKVTVPKAMERHLTKVNSIPSRYHLAIGRAKGPKLNEEQFNIAVLAKELNGRIVAYRIYYQR